MQYYKQNKDYLGLKKRENQEPAKNKEFSMKEMGKVV
jgi:hypothetical protein